ncbi:uncharacterized protein LOC119282162 [Triticum dicoccoides]|uniref:uncharacterized protein LOC119282162 n=1 Tax=Triticum dicoccoides TaxID=85692 RepID=UPI00188F4365|nr:uncharacterized protein LOC119282162 [Triticum dicoccoides]
MDGDRRSPAAAAAASAASVLDDDDLLREILLRLGFPTCLVGAALVSKRWLHHASAPAFLRRFRERNPPRLLGFCLCYSIAYQCQFVPLPQPPELAAPARRAASSCDDAFARRSLRTKHCRNGRLILDSFHDDILEHALLAPLLAGELAAVLPRTPQRNRGFEDRTQKGFTGMFLPGDGGCDGITLVNLWKVERKAYAEVYVLGSGGWGVPAGSVAEVELPDDTLITKMLPPVNGKLFMETSFGCTLGLDLAGASFFTLELPAGVQSNYMLSCAEESGLYLVSADGFQLSVWLHGMTGGGNAAGGWLLVDTFCVHETHTRLPHGNYVDVVAVGDNADFVFLDHPASGAVFYVHLKSRVVEKVHQRKTREFASSRIDISPFMTIWPPVFPARNVGHDQEE